MMKDVKEQTKVLNLTNNFWQTIVEEGVLMGGVRLPPPPPYCFLETNNYHIIVFPLDWNICGMKTNIKIRLVGPFKTKYCK